MATLVWKHTEVSNQGRLLSTRRPFSVCDRIVLVDIETELLIALS